MNAGDYMKIIKESDCNSALETLIYELKTDTNYDEIAYHINEYSKVDKHKASELMDILFDLENSKSPKECRNEIINHINSEICKLKEPRVVMEEDDNNEGNSYSRIMTITPALNRKSHKLNNLDRKVKGGLLSDISDYIAQTTAAIQSGDLDSASRLIRDLFYDAGTLKEFANEVLSISDGIKSLCNTFYYASKNKNESIVSFKLSEFFRYNNVEFHIRSDKDNIQITQIHPYDDAEYSWAKSIDGGEQFSIYRAGKFIEQFAPSSFEEDEESGIKNFNWNEVARELLKLDKNVEAKIDHT